MQRLQLYCEQECDAIDDDVYEQKLKTAADFDPLASSDEDDDDNSDDESKEQETTRSRKNRSRKDSAASSDNSEDEVLDLEKRTQARLQARLEERQASAALIAQDAKRVRSYQKVGMLFLSFFLPVSSLVTTNNYPSSQPTLRDNPIPRNIYPLNIHVSSLPL